MKPLILHLLYLNPLYSYALSAGVSPQAHKSNMDSLENPLSERTNELAAQRLQCYQGCAAIKLHNLRFDADTVLGSRPLDKSNVDRLFDLFEIEGCGNLEPEHRIAALIDRQILETALSKSNLTLHALLDPTNQPRLSFTADIQLTCVYGKHRINAADAFGVKWWLVDLYLDG